MSRFTQLLLFLLIACGGLLASPSATSQITRDAVTIGTTPGNPRRAGFSMSLATSRTAGNGYQPVYMTFTPAVGVFPADRNFEVLLTPQAQSDSDIDLTYRFSCQVKQGSASSEFVCYVPYYVPWERIMYMVFEEGDMVEGTQQWAQINSLATRYAKQTTTVGVLHPSPQAPSSKTESLYPDVRTLVTLLGDGPINEDFETPRLRGLPAHQLVNSVQPAWVQFRPIDPSAMHESWLGYSQLDIILAHGPTLAAAKTSANPRQFEAITDWVAAGGNLWIYDAKNIRLLLGNDTLAPISESKVPDESLTTSLLNLSVDNDTTELLYQNWGNVQKASSDWSWKQNNSNGLSKRKTIFDKLKKAEHPSVEFRSKSDIVKSIRTTKFGLGTITTIDDPDPFPGSFQFWRTVVSLHGEKQLQWIPRNGIDVQLGDDHYWSWLIRSVGGPPVKIFFFINTLFILIVGPIAYRYFRKHHRMYLLLFFAPSLALLVTLGLVVSAIAADGLQLRLRARQITWQDAEASYIVNNDRATYFSAIGSARGIEVPERTALFPVLNIPAIHSYYQTGRSNLSTRKVELIDDEYRFSEQFLPSRSQVQYLSLTPQKSEPLVTFDFSSSEPTVTNHSAHPLEKVMVCDSKKQYWISSAVKSETTSRLTLAKSPSPADELGVDPISLVNPIPQIGRSYYFNSGSQGAALSMTEQKLNLWLSQLPLSSFIATTQLNQELLGVENAVVEESVAIIMGELP